MPYRYLCEAVNEVGAPIGKISATETEISCGHVRVGTQGESRFSYVWIVGASAQ